MVRVRYWAGARAMAQTAEEVVEAPTLGGVLDEVRRIHGAGMTRLLGACVLLVDGAQITRDAARPLSPDSVVEILPPYAGGAR